MQAIFYLLLLLSSLWICNGANVTKPGKDPKYAIRVTKIVCPEQPYRLTTLHVCKVRLRRNQPTLISIEIDVPVTLHQMFVDFQMYYKLRTYQPMMMTFSIEVCKFFGQPRGTEPVADFVYDAFKVYVPQIIHPCPYGNRYYNVSNWTLDERHVPISMPAGDYRVDGRASDKDNVTLLNIQLYATVRSKGIASLSLLDW